jgi:hypothetical protein
LPQTTFSYPLIERKIFEQLYRHQCQLLRIEGVAWSAQKIPTAVNFGFLDRGRYFLEKLALHFADKRWSLGRYGSLAD